MTDVLPAIVYLLCALTSLVCALLLIRKYRSNRQRLLLFVGACFVGLASNNALLVIDRMVFLGTDLSVMRAAVSLATMGGLLFALIWEAG